MTIVYQPIMNGYPSSLTNKPAQAVTELAARADGRSVADYRKFADSLRKELGSLEAVGYAGSTIDLDKYMLDAGEFEMFEIAIHDVSVAEGTDSRIGTLDSDEMFIPGSLIQSALYDFAIEGLELEDLQNRIESRFLAEIKSDISESEAKEVVANLRASGQGMFGEAISAKLFTYSGSSKAFLKQLPTLASELFTEIVDKAYPEEVLSNGASM